CYCFFFQAEDGIRDYKVTGVQTCALPISSGDMNPIHHDETYARAAGYEAPLAVGMFQAGILNAFATQWLGPENVRRTKVRWEERSEERRVGKEWRLRGRANQ